jgi:hypothetical protein
MADANSGLLKTSGSDSWLSATLASCTGLGIRRYNDQESEIILPGLILPKND